MSRTSLDRQIAMMEERVLNARTIEASAAFHDRLDVLRERRALRERESGVTDYERGYQAGYHAGIRHCPEDET